MRREIPAFLGLALLATSSLASAQIADPDDAPTMAAKKTADTESPSPDGVRFKALTPIEDVEWHTPHPGYLWLLQKIASGTADKRIMRQHYWLHTRLEPFDRTFPAGWREAARARQLAPSPATRAASAAAALPAVGRWIPSGPSTIPGRVSGLARPAGIPGAILVAMADGGAWLTRDDGAHWDALTEREATQASGSVLADPTDPRVLYWGTGEGNGAIDNYGGIGLLRSTDGGRTWSASNSFSGTIRCLGMDVSSPQTIWACGNDDLYRSNDAGASFAKVAGPAGTYGASAVAIRPDLPATIFAGMWAGGVWRSTDSGATWARLAGGLPADLGRSDLSICRANPNVMVAASELNSGQVWKSADGGDTWALLSAAPSGGVQTWYDLTVAIAPDDCNTIYWGGQGSYVTRDGGQTWAQMPTSGTGSAGWDYHAILTGPNGEVVLGADAGVFRSTDWGATFAPRSDNLPTTQFYGGCGHDTDATWLAGGTQDNGTDQSSSVQPWRYVLGGDGGKCIATASRILAEYTTTNIQRSLDGGATFSDANSGIRTTDPKPWVGIIARDPSDWSTSYVGTYKIYRTTDFHDTSWVPVSAPLYYNRLVTAIAVSPADRNVLWAGFDYGGLFRTTDALDAAPAYANIRGGWPSRAISRVAPHPSDPGSAWVVVGGFGYPKIERTTDSGTTYVDVTGDLPDVPVTDLVVDPGDASVLYAGTDLGVFRSGDGGAHWTGFSDGLPLTAIADLFRHPAGGDLVVATHGRSFYRFRPASSGAVAVPDGDVIQGVQMRAERTGTGALWLRWDTLGCTAGDYNLFYGPLGSVAQGTYTGSVCGLGRGGEAVVPMPGAPGDSLYFRIAAVSSSGVEGPHGFASGGAPSLGSGVGSCGVTAHQDVASCP